MNTKEKIILRFTFLVSLLFAIPELIAAQSRNKEVHSICDGLREIPTFPGGDIKL